MASSNKRLPKKETSSTLVIEYPNMRDLPRNSEHIELIDQEFFIPVHGFIELNDAEKELVCHPAVQRLKTIYQLGQAHMVYPGATHKRFEHVLGVLFTAQRIIDAVNKNRSNIAARLKLAERKNDSAELKQKFSTWGEAISPREQAFIRAAALLHDIGHLPAGHTLEDELHFLDRHDEHERISLVFDRLSWRGEDYTESLGALIDRLYKDLVPTSLEQDYGIRARDLVEEIMVKSKGHRRTTKAPPSEQDKTTKANPKILDVVRGLDAKRLFLRIDLCRDIVANTICADLLDYLHRDWYHVGKVKQFNRRLFQYMEIRRPGPNPSKDERNAAFVISLGYRPHIRTDAVTAILKLLESRYELTEAVLFHKTKCAAAAMLERGIRELEPVLKTQLGAADLENSWKRALTERLLDQSDDESLTYLRDLSKSNPIKGVSLGLMPLSRLVRGERYKCVHSRFYSDFQDNDRLVLQRRYSGWAPEEEDVDKYALERDACENRNKAVNCLEDDLGLEKGSVVMYCPDRYMNAKINRVKVHIDDHVKPFNEYEGIHKASLSGGHLEAQNERFRQLWRMHFYVERGVWRKVFAEHPERILFFKDVINNLILEDGGPEVEKVMRSWGLAKKAKDLGLLAIKPESEMLETEEALVLKAANELKSAVGGSYPGGIPSLRAFVNPVEGKIAKA